MIVAVVAGLDRLGRPAAPRRSMRASKRSRCASSARASSSAGPCSWSLRCCSRSKVAIASSRVRARPCSEIALASTASGSKAGSPLRMAQRQVQLAGAAAKRAHQIEVGAVDVGRHGLRRRARLLEETLQVVERVGPGVPWFGTYACSSAKVIGVPSAATYSSAPATGTQCGKRATSVRKRPTSSSGLMPSRTLPVALQEQALAQAHRRIAALRVRWADAAARRSRFLPARCMRGSG